MKCPIQWGEAKLNGTFHLSPNENICSIAQMAVFQNDRKHVGRNLIEQMAGIFDLGQMSCNHFSYI